MTVHQCLPISHLECCLILNFCPSQIKCLASWHENSWKHPLLRITFIKTPFSFVFPSPCLVSESERRAAVNQGADLSLWISRMNPWNILTCNLYHCAIQSMLHITAMEIFILKEGQIKLLPQRSTLPNILILLETAVLCY